jgi:hypothetical protein
MRRKGGPTKGVAEVCLERRFRRAGDRASDLAIAANITTYFTGVERGAGKSQAGKKEEKKKNKKETSGTRCLPRGLQSKNGDTLGFTGMEVRRRRDGKVGRIPGSNKNRGRLAVQGRSFFPMRLLREPRHFFRVRGFVASASVVLKMGNARSGLPRRGMCVN